MNLASLIRLLTLSAIWGAAFIFIRMGAPVLGPTLLIELRVALAAVFLSVAGYFFRKQLNARAHWRHFLVLGMFNTALPFTLFAMAAQTLSASLLSILNATAPLWGALIAAVWSRKALTIRTGMGLALGIVGVGVLTGFDPSSLNDGALLAILLALGGAFSYGIASTYASIATKVEPFANSLGSLWVAVLIVGPAVPFFTHAFTPTPIIMASVLALGVVCTGMAFLLYFRLVADIGPASALTVTFLIPVFGILFGHIFLDEPIGLSTLLGASIVILGTALVTGFSVSSLLPKAAASKPIS
jgi:drug/metabolite transporter (DMT)-like permease